MRLMDVMGRILVMPSIILMMLGVMRMHFAGIRAFVRMRLAFIGLGGLRGILAGALDDSLRTRSLGRGGANCGGASGGDEERFSLSSSASRWARSSASISA